MTGPMSHRQRVAIAAERNATLDACRARGAAEHGLYAGGFHCVEGTAHGEPGDGPALVRKAVVEAGASAAPTTLRGAYARGLEPYAIP